MKVKKIAKIIFLYLLVSFLMWAFSVSYSNSYNRMNEDKIQPVSISVNKNEVTINVLHNEVTADFDFLNPESKFYYIIYFLSSDSMRLAQFVLIESV